MGKTGRVVKRLSPEGLVTIEGEIWKAVAAEEAPIDEGSIVRVVDVRGTVLLVEAVRSGVPVRGEEGA